MQYGECPEMVAFSSREEAGKRYRESEKAQRPGFECRSIFSMERSLGRSPPSLDGTVILQTFPKDIRKRAEYGFGGVRFQTPSSMSFSGLTEFWGGSELSEFLSAYYLCVNANSPSSSQNSLSLSETQ